MQPPTTSLFPRRFGIAALALFAAITLLIIRPLTADQPRDTTFQAFLVKLDSAQRELQNGRPNPFKELWSHADDTTLSGGFGGTIEKGWDQISKRLDWVGAQFTNGTNTIERISAQFSGDLAYVVQLEHIRFTVPGQTHQTTRDYRVTMVFRRENGDWRIIHRQADSNLTKQPPK